MGDRGPIKIKHAESERSVESVELTPDAIIKEIEGNFKETDRMLLVAMKGFGKYLGQGDADAEKRRAPAEAFIKRMVDKGDVTQVYCYTYALGYDSSKRYAALAETYTNIGDVEKSQTLCAAIEELRN